MIQLERTFVLPEVEGMPLLEKKEKKKKDLFGLP